MRVKGVFMNSLILFLLTIVPSCFIGGCVVGVFAWAVLALEPMNQWICMKKLNVSSSKVERGCLSFLVIYYTSLIKWIILSIAGHIIAFMLVIQNQVKDTESILTLLINIGIIAIIIGIIMLPVAKNTIKRIKEKESKE